MFFLIFFTTQLYIKIRVAIIKLQNENEQNMISYCQTIYLFPTLYLKS